MALLQLRFVPLLCIAQQAVDAQHAFVEAAGDRLFVAKRPI
jgi:hypothetical protein